MQSRKPLWYAVGTASLAAVIALGVGVARAQKPALTAGVNSDTSSSVSSSSPSVSPSGPASTPSSPSGGSGASDAGVDTRAIEDALQAYVDDRGGDAAVAVYDRTTGTSISVNGSDEFQTASIVKVDIVAALMLQKQAAGAALTAQEKAWAKAALTVSDNDAASSLYREIGGASGLRAANATLGLRETTPDSSWGMTTTTADDQIRLLDAISGAGGPLSAANRALLAGWMSSVTAEQRFGVTAGADESAEEVYVKVGWVDLDDQNGLWATNSVGRVVEDDHDWLIAVLSDHNESFASGKKLITGIVTEAMDRLRAADQ
ncbi:MAG: hypothetical protein HOV79_07985 [Hamadaea sp.]|nr:hypothetical protein [Hamadaea sp.]